MRLCFHLHKTTMTCMLLWWSLHTDKPSQNFLLGLDTECQMPVCQVSITVIKGHTVQDVSVAAWRHYSEFAVSDSGKGKLIVHAHCQVIKYRCHRPGNETHQSTVFLQKWGHSETLWTQGNENKPVQAEGMVSAGQTATHFWWVMSDDWEGLFQALARFSYFVTVGQPLQSHAMQPNIAQTLRTLF